MVIPGSFGAIFLQLHKMASVILSEDFVGSGKHLFLIKRFLKAKPKDKPGGVSGTTFTPSS